jgi:PAS domain S-box-containing protein
VDPRVISRARWQRAELARESSEERCRAVLELTGAGVWITDGEGRTTSVDPRLCKMLGYRSEQMQGRPISDFLAQAEEGAGDAPLGDGNRAGLAEEAQLRRGNGSAISVRLSSKRLGNGGGEPSGVLTLVSEAAGRKKAEAETEILKNEFFALISHELRTPLTSMMGYLDLIAETQGERMNEQGRDFLGVIDRNTGRLLTLLNDLMLLTQVEAGTFAIECDQTNVSAIASRSIEEAMPTAEKADVELAFSPGQQFACWADGNRLGQVLDNLILNAIKFTPAGGHVKVRVAESGDDAVIEVADDGPGIAAGEHKRLFGRFYQGSDARSQQVQGLGLGLAITKAIVDAHEGEIKLESEPGRGTTFTVKLPRRRPEPGSARWAKTSAVRKGRPAAIR